MCRNTTQIEIIAFWELIHKSEGTDGEKLRSENWNGAFWTIWIYVITMMIPSPKYPCLQKQSLLFKNTSLFLLKNQVLTWRFYLAWEYWFSLRLTFITSHYLQDSRNACILPFHMLKESQDWANFHQRKPDEYVWK